MTHRKAIVFLLGICGLFVAQTASAQPRWGRERTPDIGACFYENIEFGGRYFCVRPGEVVNRMPPGMNDRISSMRIFGRTTVRVFRDPDLRGRSAQFGGDIRDLRREGWNDTISSIEVSGRRDEDRRDEVRREDEIRGDRPLAWGHERVPREGACFYREPGFRGDYFCVARGLNYPSLPGEFNNSIRSIRVFGAAVHIYLDRDFRGRSAEVVRDAADLRGMWRDNISSIRVQ